MEACIARNLMDTSVYFWPGYVSTSVMSLSDSPPLGKSPWLTFMEGTPLNNSLINALAATPASRCDFMQNSDSILVLSKVLMIGFHNFSSILALRR